jgi:flagellar biosynthetic protein FliQ
VTMNEADALELARSAIWTILVVSGPAVGAAMVVGIVIALFQALTQIQEMTLTFVPKILIVLAVLTIGASFIGSQMYVFTEQVYSRIEKGY